MFNTQRYNPDSKRNWDTVQNSIWLNICLKAVDDNKVFSLDLKAAMVEAFLRPENIDHIKNRQVVYLTYLYYMLMFCLWVVAVSFKSTVQMRHNKFCSNAFSLNCDPSDMDNCVCFPHDSAVCIIIMCAMGL